MRWLDDAELLAAYASRHSEEAFAMLVERHVGMVYSSALRQVGNPHLAEEITQAVFIILARKAGHLNRKTVLAGWLCRTACFTANNALKAERRRQHWEQEACMESLESNPDLWPHIAPLLDEAVAQLGEADRNAVVLRYYQQRPLAEVGRALGWNADTAQKRVSRALEKLRKFFNKRGVVLSVTAIAGAVSANSVQAAPVGLAQIISTAALAKGAAAGGSTITLVKGALKLMAWTKVKTAVVIGAGILLAVGTTTVIVKKAIPATPAAMYEAIFKHPSSQCLNLLESAPPTFIFHPTQFPQKIGSGFWSPSGKSVAVNFPLQTLFAIAYGVNYAQVAFPDDFNLGNSNYDLLITLPSHQKEALQEELKKQFGLTAHMETRETEVLLLKIADPAKLQLYKTKGGGYRNYQAGDWPVQKQIFRDAGLAIVADYVEVEKPVLDRTGTKEHYDFNFQWTEQKWFTTDARKSAFQSIWAGQLNQVGLELVPDTMPNKMLVVEKAAD